METERQQDTKVPASTITTIKLSHETKARLDHLKLYKRETYEEILQRLLTLLNITRNSPEKARFQLLKLEREHKRNVKGIK